MADKKINFRATSGYVTDDADQTYALGEGTSQTRNGHTFQWAVTANASDRTTGATPSPELSGYNYSSDPIAANRRFQITLDEAGTYDIRVACGDEAYEYSGVNFRLLDDTTEIAAVSGVNQTAGNYVDAGGTLRSTATWQAGGDTKVRHTFASTTFRIEMGDTIPINCVQLITVAASGQPTTKRLFGQPFSMNNAGLWTPARS